MSDSHTSAIDSGEDGAQATRRLVVVSNWLTALRRRLGEGS
jgi:hypothetical protein